ncbi:MAG: hypothetical protein D6760_07765 [Deltaproteobacteria bacterium]|nr:MAG: hypothetical protein D6760_07765 [Deltaproteobacteria bacterium]
MGLAVANALQQLGWIDVGRLRLLLGLLTRALLLLLLLPLALLLLLFALFLLLPGWLEQSNGGFELFEGGLLIGANVVEGRGIDLQIRCCAEHGIARRFDMAGCLIEALGKGGLLLGLLILVAAGRGLALP